MNKDLVIGILVSLFIHAGILGSEYLFPKEKKVAIAKNEGRPSMLPSGAATMKGGSLPVTICWSNAWASLCKKSFSSCPAPCRKMPSGYFLAGS